LPKSMGLAARWQSGFANCIGHELPKALSRERRAISVHDCGEVPARTRFKRTAQFGMHRDYKRSARLLLHNTNLFAGCSPYHPRSVTAPLACVEQQVERESLLCSDWPPRFKLTDLGFRPGMNLN